MNKQSRELGTNNILVKGKETRQGLDHSLQVLNKLDEASDVLKQKSNKRIKISLRSGIELILKRVEVITLADKSEFGWVTVNEYLSEKLASDSEENLPGREEGEEKNQ